MVPVQSADVQRSPAAYHLAILDHIIGAAARLQPQPAVSPELTLAAKAIRGLHLGQQHRRAQRTEKRHRAQQLRGRRACGSPPPVPAAPGGAAPAPRPARRTTTPLAAAVPPPSASPTIAGDGASPRAFSPHRQSPDSGTGP